MFKAVASLAAAFLTRMDATQPHPQLSDLELEVIDLFVSVTRVAGLPKSIGEIYGLLFIAPGPIPMEDITRRLGISKGSASQGLRQLRAFGAVRATYIPGDRRDHFEARTVLRDLAAGFLREQIEPHLKNAPARMRRMERALENHPPEQVAHAKARIERLSNWHKRSSALLPLVLKLTGK